VKASQACKSGKCILDTEAATASNPNGTYKVRASLEIQKERGLLSRQEKIALDRCERAVNRHQLKRKQAELSDHRTTREGLLSQGMATDAPTIVAMNTKIGKHFQMVTCYNRELNEISEEHPKDLREKEKQDRKRR
jgi:hypothetical protein